jgi:hypothetical protein
MLNTKNMGSFRRRLRPTRNSMLAGRAANTKRWNVLARSGEDRVMLRLSSHRMRIRYSSTAIEPLRISLGWIVHRRTRYRGLTSDSTIGVGYRVLSGYTRFGCLDGVGIVRVIVANVISRVLEFNKLGTDLISRDRRI